MEVKIYCDLKKTNTLPKYITKFESGADVVANIEEEIMLNGFERILVPTGVYPEIPVGFEIQVRPKSGLALKYGITVLNTPGTIDASYRSQIAVILINTSPEPFVITKGMKIAQLVLAKVEQANYVLVDSRDELSKTERGECGFGQMTEKQKYDFLQK